MMSNNNFLVFGGFHFFQCPISCSLEYLELHFSADLIFRDPLFYRYELSYDGEKAVCNGSFGSTTATSVPLQAVNTSDRGIDKAVINENEKHHAHVGHSQNGDKSQSRGNHDAEKAQGVVENFDRFKWARCKQPLPQKVMRAIGIPLPPEYVEVLEENLDWEETQWSQTGVWVRGKEYPLARAHFVSSM